MVSRGRKPVESYFTTDFPELENAWAGVDKDKNEPILTSREKNIYLKKAIEAYLASDADSEQPKIAAFLHMDSDSSFSFKIPRSTFMKCLVRFVHHRVVRNSPEDFVFFGDRKGRKPLTPASVKEAEETCRKLQSVSLLIRVHIFLEIS